MPLLSTAASRFLLDESASIFFFSLNVRLLNLAEYHFSAVVLNSYSSLSLAIYLILDNYYLVSRSGTMAGVVFSF